MGIEPTSRTVNVRPNDFEDRGPHQRCKHFQRLGFPISSANRFVPSGVCLEVATDRG
jgi:hypothetical protein